MPTSTYAVTGMTCGHCVAAVTEKIKGLAGVRDVQVDLPSGRVTVTGERVPSTDDVRTAVEDAGFALAGQASSDR